MKLTRRPLSPLDKMFTGPPVSYTPGSTKRLTPDDDAPGPMRAPSPPPPQMDAAIRECQARAQASLDATHFDTAETVATEFEIDAVQLYGAWRLSTAIESGAGRK
ncbi:MAG: hypothetical protein ABSD90_15360 [Methylocystis sp.]